MVMIRSSEPRSCVEDLDGLRDALAYSWKFFGVTKHFLFPVGGYM
jgi:hypothetical protein